MMKEKTIIIIQIIFKHFFFYYSDTSGYQIVIGKKPIGTSNSN